MRGEFGDAAGFLGLDLFGFHELPAADHRREHAMPLDIVMIENEIDVNQGEDREQPEHGIVEEPQVLLAAEQRHDPIEQVREPELAHRRIKRETR